MITKIDEAKIAIHAAIELLKGEVPVKVINEHLTCALEALEVQPQADNSAMDAILALAEKYVNDFGMGSDQRSSVLHFAKWAQEQHQ